MAGYIMNLRSLDALKFYINNGVYSTVLRTPTNNFWRTNHEGTFADYVTMKPGDNLYFFIKRKIYGIGELIDICGDCKFKNYPNSDKPYAFDYHKVKPYLLLDEGSHSVNQRVICLFRANPCFFKKGIDMDDVLSSNPSKFNNLRAFWKLSFIKIDDDENQALKDVILKFNQEELNEIGKNNNIKYTEFQLRVREKIEKNSDEYKFDINDVLKSCSNGKKLRHEMALEAGLLYQLTNKDPNTIKVFGKWDYLSHQVIASPFKPIDYMDKMDIYGYSYISGFAPTKSKYLIIELKKDEAMPQDIDQLLKYVDWVREKYAYGDYSMIKAYLVAYDFSNKIKEHTENVGVRKYTIGRRPARSKEWKDLQLIRYRFNDKNCVINFEKI